MEKRKAVKERAGELYFKSNYVHINFIFNYMYMYEHLWVSPVHMSVGACRSQ